ncbi:unnamed protein product [Discosporangium mesarthrocarpum]
MCRVLFFSSLADTATNLESHPPCGPKDAGLLGAALVYVIQLGGLFQWTVRQSAEVTNAVLLYP